MRTLTLKLSFAVGVVLATAMAVPAPASAQGEECYKCNEDTPEGPHRFSEVSGGVFFECDPFTCHLEDKAGSCTVHNDCGVSEEEDLDALAAALEREDISEFRAAITSFSDAHINFVARSVDILCGERLIARIDVPPESMRWLAATEPVLIPSTGS